MSNLAVQKTFTNKAISILLGVFISSLILATLLNKFGQNGIYLGIAANALLTFGGFYYCERKSYARYMTYGILTTIIIGLLLYIIGMTMLKSAYEGF